MDHINEEIRKIHERNKHVELNKAWETSLTRRTLICLITFLTFFLFVRVSGITDDLVKSFYSALIPTFAYVFSTLSLPTFRKYWEQWKK